MPAEYIQPFRPEVNIPFKNNQSSNAHKLQLPWYSIGSRDSFPERATPRRRRRRNLHTRDDAVALPQKHSRESVEGSANDDAPVEEKADEQLPIREAAATVTDSQAPSAEDASSETSTIAAPSEPETPATSQAPSESDFAQVSTPATPAQITPISPKPTPAQQHTRSSTRSAIAVPNIPGLPRAKDVSPPSTASQGAAQKSEVAETPAKAEDVVNGADTTPVETVAAGAQASAPEAPKPVPKPKSWADLVKSQAKPKPLTNTINGQAVTNGIQLPKTAPLADALRQYSVQSDAKLAFLEPRGLVNTGNMCYMNSVRQPTRTSWLVQHANVL